METSFYEGIIMDFYTAEIFQEMMEGASINLKSNLNACVQWMKDNNLESCRNVGPFNLENHVKGDIVKIRKGARVYSTSPSFTSDGKVTKRCQTVTVARTSKGFVDYNHSSRHPTVRNAEVHWAGSGGYWHWTDINNVEPVRQQVIREEESV